jgi:integrase
MQARGCARARGKNVRLYVLKRFGDWLSKKVITEQNPFALLRPYNEKKDRAHVRRAMWPGECERFLKAVRGRQIEHARAYRVHAGLTKEAMIKLRREGRVRALVYNTVAQTGLRRKETKLLLIKNVDFENGVIWLPQDVAKSGHEQYVRLNSDLARRLRAYIRTLENTEPDAPLFPLPGHGTASAPPRAPSRRSRRSTRISWRRACPRRTPAIACWTSTRSG